MKTMQMIMAALLLTGLLSCGGKKQMTTNIRGVQLEAEACEELALKSALRASGMGTSPKEAFAKSIAVLNAKATLGRAIGEQVSGMIRSFNQQHNAYDINDYVGKDSEIAEGYFEQFLTNVRTICSNTYVTKDGTYNVYVCVELGDETLTAMHKKLSEDKKIAIDFSEHQFKQEMEKAKEDFRQQRGN